MIKTAKYNLGGNTNEGLVMTNRRLREDLDDINTHYQELIYVSKESLRRNKQTQSQFGELNQTIKDLIQQNERLSKKIEYMEVEQ